MESIAERWARANRANPTTMKTYKNCAISLLEDYIGFMENPGAFKGRGGGGGAPKKADRKEERRQSPGPRTISTHLAPIGSRHARARKRVVVCRRPPLEPKMRMRCVDPT
jgi:hypothetical protein